MEKETYVNEEKMEKDLDDARDEAESLDLEESVEKEEVVEKKATKEDFEIAFSATHDFLEKMVDFLKTDSTVILEEKDDHIKARIEGGHISKIIGYRGETLDALQLLSSIIVNNKTSAYVPIQIDAEQYREKRIRSLERLAHNLAKKCMRTRKTQRLEPMNPYERRVVHLALDGHEEVMTESIGEGLNKQVTIKLKNPDEYGESDFAKATEYGTSEAFKRKGASNMRKFGHKERRF